MEGYDHCIARFGNDLQNIGVSHKTETNKPETSRNSKGTEQATDIMHFTFGAC